MKLYALSDVHLDHEINRLALESLAPHPEDWLILAGDVSSTFRMFETGLSVLSRKFARVLWVPGNHDLWTLPDDECDLVGEARYLRLVELCREMEFAAKEKKMADMVNRLAAVRQEHGKVLKKLSEWRES